MNICIFAKYLPVHITGGMEIHIHELVGGLAGRGHKVSIITSRHPEEIKKEERKNLTIYYLRSEAKHTRERYYRESAKLFDEMNQKEDFDLVHSQSTLAYGYVKYSKKNMPLVVTSHGTALGEFKTILQGRQKWKSFFGLPLWLKRYLLDERVTFQEAGRIIAVSNELKEDIERQYKIPEEKLITIPNGIDTNRFKPLPVEDLRKRWNLTDEKVILCVGNLGKGKAVQLVLKVLPSILKQFNVKLLIVGTGRYLPELKDLAEKLNLVKFTTFTGGIPNQELQRYYNLADVFIMPTMLLEGLPLVILEAMACEKPVIASRIGGIPTVIKSNEDGILIEPGNLKELEEKILEVLSDKELAKRLGKNARKKVVERFSLDRMVEDTIRVYKDVLKRD